MDYLIPVLVVLVIIVGAAFMFLRKREPAQPGDAIYEPYKPRDPYDDSTI